MDNANHQILEWYHEVDDNSVRKSKLIASRVQVVVVSMPFTKPKLMSHCIPQSKRKRKHNKLIFGFIVKIIYCWRMNEGWDFDAAILFELLENVLMRFFLFSYHFLDCSKSWQIIVQRACSIFSIFFHAVLLVESRR